MADNHETQKHSSSALWSRVDKHGDQISELTAAIAKTDANLTTLAASVDTGFASLRKSIEGLAATQNRPVNYIAWVGAIVSILVVFGGYSFLIFGPLQASVLHNRSEDSRQNQILFELHGQVQYANGRSEALQDQLDDVDMNGSRAWNRNPKSGE